MAIEDSFWEEWTGRIKRQSGKFITPANPLVREHSRKIDTGTGERRDERAVRVWEHVASTIEYKLSKEWKTPGQTLKEGVGDCEDVTFLVASMLPNVGVDESVIKLGEIDKGGEVEAHTWNVVGGKIIDATAMPGENRGIEYIEKGSIKLIPREYDGRSY